MTSFQLDQCLDSKRFVRACGAEGLCQALRLPAILRGAEDPDLLHALMAQEHPLVTFDRALPREHTGAIPAVHPGIIVVSNFPSLQTMTIRIAQRQLSQFKASFEAWRHVRWCNSIVELTSVGVEVWHVEEAQLLQDGYVAFDSDDWTESLRRLLQQNAKHGHE